MSTIKLSDTNEIKCKALNSMGIIINNYKYNERTKYIITLKDYPKAENFIETTFNSINEILLAFSDRLVGYQIIRG